MFDLIALVTSPKFVSGVLTGGGLLTIWKWLAGWNKTNLTLLIEMKRTPSSEQDIDHLVCYLKLKKGDRSTIALQGINLVLIANGSEILNQSVEEIRIPNEHRNLNITPGEEAQFAFHHLVPHTAICKSIGTVTGRALQRWGTLATWKATDYSVPALPNDSTVKKAP